MLKQTKNNWILLLLFWSLLHLPSPSPHTPHVFQKAFFEFMFIYVCAISHTVGLSLSI